MSNRQDRLAPRQSRVQFSLTSSQALPELLCLRIVVTIRRSGRFVLDLQHSNLLSNCRELLEERLRLCFGIIESVL